jgi:hypothetical protein
VTILPPDIDPALGSRAAMKPATYVNNNSVSTNAELSLPKRKKIETTPASKAGDTQTKEADALA